MIGVILAAGMAKRLRPLTDTKPKCLLKVGERTLLERTVCAMQQAGITEFVVVTGYRADQIVDFLGTLNSQLSTLNSQLSPSTSSITPTTSITTTSTRCGWLVSMCVARSSC